jgi:hypothetical protein
MTCPQLGTQTKRKDRDFTFLRDNLVKLFPFSIIPPVKSVNIYNLFITSEENYKRNMRDFNQFFNAVLENPILRSHKLVEKFLTSSQEEIHVLKPQYDMQPKLESPSDITTFSGELKYDIRPDNFRPVDDIKRETEKKIDILKNINNNFLNIIKNLDQLNKCFEMGEKLFEDLQKEYKKIDNSFSILDELSKFFKICSNSYKNKYTLYI